MLTVKLVVLGDGGTDSGKTALTIQLCLNHFIEAYDPTIEDSYRKHAIIDDQPVLIEILDTAGRASDELYRPLTSKEEEYFALRDQWCREGDGFLLVYSITSRATFERVEHFRAQIARVKDVEHVPIILVGNKSDRQNEREVGKEEAQAMARKLGCELIETSAKTRANLELAYYTLVRMIRSQREGQAPGDKARRRRQRNNVHY